MKQRRLSHFLTILIVLILTTFFLELDVWSFAFSHPAVVFPVLFVGAFCNWAILEVFSSLMEGTLSRVESLLSLRSNFVQVAVAWTLRTALIAGFYWISMHLMPSKTVPPMAFGWIFSIVLLGSLALEGLLFILERGSRVVFHSEFFSASKAFLRTATMMAPLILIVTFFSASMLMKSATVVKNGLGLNRSVAQCTSSQTQSTAPSLPRSAQ